MVRGTCIWPLRASDCVDVDACVDDEDGPPRADGRRILARVQQQVATGGSDSAANVGLSLLVVRLELCPRKMYTIELWNDDNTSNKKKVGMYGGESLCVSHC